MILYTDGPATHEEAAMNAFRAKRIADNLNSIRSFQVRNRLYRLEVEYRGDLARFDSEAAFWVFVFKVAQAAHEEGVVSEVEARLQA